MTTAGLRKVAMGACLVFVFAWAWSAQADERNAVNSVFVEILGPGTIWSVNYERMIIDDLGVRVGASYMRWSAGVGDSKASSDYYAFPITASYVGVGNGRHSLELSAGVTVSYASGSAEGLGFESSGSGATAMGTVGVGYRFHPLSTGFHFRVGLGGLMGMGFGTWYDADADAFGFLPWGYISFGATF